MLLQGVCLLSACILCDTAPQTKRSVIEACYQLVFIGPEMMLSKGWKDVLVLLHTECFQTKLVADLLFFFLNLVQRYDCYNLIPAAQTRMVA